MMILAVLAINFLLLIIGMAAAVGFFDLLGEMARELHQGDK